MNNTVIPKLSKKPPRTSLRKVCASILYSIKNAEPNTTAFSTKEKTTNRALLDFLGIKRHRYVEAIKVNNKMMITMAFIKIHPPIYRLSQKG